MLLGDYEDKYKKWWLNKPVRYAHKPEDEFAICKCITVHGCLSGFTHNAELHLDDGSILCLPIWDEFRPRKKDILVKELSDLWLITYPEDIFDGSSGDEGVLKVVRIRQLLKAVQCEHKTEN